jgi:hypothetical protein
MEIWTKEKPIDWTSPAYSEDVTFEDFQKMIEQAEKSKTISFKEHTKRVNEWMKNTLCKEKSLINLQLVTCSCM